MKAFCVCILVIVVSLLIAVVSAEETEEEFGKVHKAHGKICN